MTDLVLRSRAVALPDGVRPAAVHVSGGRIERVTAWDEAPTGPSLVDLGDAALLPGVVDTHVHVNEPGRTEWEGFVTATRSAAAGGVTTVVDMPLNSIPATTTVASLRRKVEAMEGKLHVDVGLWGGVVPGNDAELLALLQEGALGFKCFMVDSGVDEFPPVSSADLERATKILADADSALLVHAEVQGPLDAARARLEREGPLDPRSYQRYLRSRPRDAEDEAIAELVRILGMHPARSHVVHLSSASALPILRRARDARLPLTAETTPHYLVFESEQIPDGATPYKCAPPIREHENKDTLWAGLREGAIGMVVTDHSPCTPELKRLDPGAGQGSFDDAWGGIASLQLGLSAVWTEAKARGATLSDLVRWMCAVPAGLAGLAHKKGSIAPGMDADLVAFEPEARFVVTKERILHRHKVTPYEGRELSGVVRSTWLRGQQAFDGSAPVGETRGAWLRGRGAR
jgi:allantoinase